MTAEGRGLESNIYLWYPLVSEDQDIHRGTGGTERDHASLYFEAVLAKKVEDRYV